VDLLSLLFLRRQNNIKQTIKRITAIIDKIIHNILEFPPLSLEVEVEDEDEDEVQNESSLSKLPHCS